MHVAQLPGFDLIVALGATIMTRVFILRTNPFSVKRSSEALISLITYIRLNCMYHMYFSDMRIYRQISKSDPIDVLTLG